jgi:RNA polymerase sigma-70 factor (ECF subfamily)
MTNYKDPLALIDALKNRDEGGFAHLYDHYSAALYGTISKIIDNDAAANDILQDTFVSIWENIDSYKAEKGTLFTWMLNIARNKAIDQLRKNNRQQKIQSIDAGVHNLDVGNIREKEMNVEAIGLKELVSKMRPDIKELIDLSYFKGMTHQEITDLKQIPLGTVKTKIRTGLLELKKIFNL